MTDVVQQFITLDKESLMMLNELNRLYAHEPQLPRDEDKPDALTTEMYSRHYDWKRQVDAWRLLLGIRLVNSALDKPFKDRAKTAP